MEMETTCAVTNWDEDKFEWGRLGTDSNFTVTDGDGGNCSFPCTSLCSHIVYLKSLCCVGKTNVSRFKEEELSELNT